MKPPVAGPFVDTNVLLYLLSSEAGKSNRAEVLLSAGIRISVQVLNEFTAVALRKFGLPWARVEQALVDIRRFATVHPLTLDAHLKGLAIARRYRLGVYDAMIVAVAVLAEATELLSEDLQHGQSIEGLVIRNPFRA